MKKTVLLLVLLCLVGVLVAVVSKPELVHGNAGSPKAAEGSAVNSGAGGDVTGKRETIAANGRVDIDLTVLSSTMVYAEVYNIMTDPETYLGKTIKVRGPYYPDYDDQSGRCYHYIVIEDATACCAQGLEFIWIGNHAYPGDYPAEGTRIEVTGVFGEYEEFGEIYYYLTVDGISVNT